MEQDLGNEHGNIYWVSDNHEGSDKARNKHAEQDSISNNSEQELIFNCHY